eukprot:277434_1
MNTMSDDFSHILEENQKLKQSVFSLQTENTILKEKIFTLNDICIDYTMKYKELISENDLLKLQQQYAHELHPKISHSQDITKLEHELQISKNEIIKKDKIIDTFSVQIAEMKELIQYKQQEIQTITTIYEQQLLTKNCKIDEINEKITTLSDQNSSLQKEKIDLLALIEEKNGNNLHLPLKMRQYTNSSSRTRTITRFQSNNTFSQKNTLSLSKTQLLVHEMDQAYLSPSDFDHSYLAKQSLSNSVFSSSLSKSNHSNTSLVDSVKELTNNTSNELFEQKQNGSGIFGSLSRFQQNKKDYLIFTAHVMTMKYPQISDISVVDLLGKVDCGYYKFWEYYDIMDAIMKKEIDAMEPKLHKQAAMSSASIVSMNDAILFENDSLIESQELSQESGNK